MTKILEKDNDLLDDLLDTTEVVEETPIDYDLSALFENKEDMEKFFHDLPVYIMNLWAQNDKIVHMMVPKGSKDALEAEIKNTKFPQLPEDLRPVLETLRSSIVFSEHEEAKNINIVTLKQAIQPQELLSAHSWANAPIIDLYDVLRQRNLIVQPSMEELRMLLLIDTLLEIREKNQGRKVVPASRMPSNLVVK